VSCNLKHGEYQVTIERNRWNILLFDH